MFDDDSYSRRQLLGAVTGVGTAGLAAGAATRAHLVDRSLFPGNRFGTGALSLDLAGAAATQGDDVAGFPIDRDFETGTALSVDFTALEAGDQGVFTAAYRLCESSGHVWLRPRLIGSGGADLLDHLQVRLDTRPNCDSGAQQDYTHSKSGPRFAGTLGEFHRTFSDGVALNCRYAGKIEGGAIRSGERFEFTTDGDEVEIELTNVERNEDDEPVEFGLEVHDGPNLCEVIVAGGTDPGSDSPGPKRTYYTYDCGTEATGLTPPENDRGPDSDGVHALSHVELYVCGDCRGCAPGCLDLEWTFDEDPPAALGGDSLGLELEFLAVQCRHRTEPTNPWK